MRAARIEHHRLAYARRARPARRRRRRRYRLRAFRRGSGCRCRRRRRCAAGGCPRFSSRSTSAAKRSAAATNGAGFGQQRADVAADAHDFDARQRRRRAGRAARRRRARRRTCSRAGRWRCRDGSSASMSGLTRSAIGARRPRPRATCVDARELGLGFDVDAARCRFSSASSISASLLPTPEKSVLRRIAAGGEHARELAAGDDVEARAQAREQREHRQVGVGLHRIADQRVRGRAARARTRRRRTRSPRASRRSRACRSGARCRRAAPPRRAACRRDRRIAHGLLLLFGLGVGIGNRLRRRRLRRLYARRRLVAQVQRPLLSAAVAASVTATTARSNAPQRTGSEGSA